MIVRTCVTRGASQTAAWHSLRVLPAAGRTLRAARLAAAGAVLVSFVAVPTARGAVLPEGEVRAAVETWVRYTTPHARPDAAVERMEPFVVEGETVAWITHLRDGGFCLGGADPVALPVYVYVPQGEYRSDDPGMRFVLEEIAGRTRVGRAAQAGEGPGEVRAALAERVEYWSGLIARREPARWQAPEELLAAPSFLLLPAAATWDQIDPYNALLPELTPGTGERALTGCNATATAMILYWWKWPTTGVGTGSVPYNYRFRTNWDSEPLSFSPGDLSNLAGRLRWTGTQLQMNGYWDNSVYNVALGVSTNTTYRTALANLWSRMTQVNTGETASFGTTVYDWSQMRDAHPPPYTSADFELARLNRHVAIACDSDLGVRSTNSFFGNDVNALKDHFRYDLDALFIPSGGTTTTMSEEIEWGRLAGLGGTNAQGAGHAWLVQGYDKSTDPNRLFWMNFGWGGSSNGWYTFDSVPFPLAHDMMTRIAPTNVHFVGAAVTGDGSPAQPYRTFADALASAPNGTILHLRAGSDHAWTGTINRPLTIQGYGAVVH